MNHFAMDWYLKEEEKQKQRMKKNQTHLINQQLSQLIVRLEGNVDREVYEDKEYLYNRHLVQSGIWYLRYANNFEDSFVMFVQCSWIQLILETESNLEDAESYQSELQRLYYQARQQDYSQSMNAFREFENLQNLM